jgi:ribosomal protein S18 acetylase RimI-like enzyme
MNIKFRHFVKKDILEIKKMIKCFYSESPDGGKISNGKIEKTCNMFTVHPEKGSLIVFELEGALIGYSILFNGWSNENSKDFIFIDELFVLKEYRGRGVGGNFLKFIKKRFKNEASALMLAVEPNNKKVINLYKKFSFKEYKNKTFCCEL